MAHPRIIAQRQAIALERLMKSARKVAKAHGLSKESKALESITSRDPAFAQMLQTEALADLLDGLANAKSYPADLGPETGEQQPPVTVETVQEEPLETIETVEIKPAEEVVSVAGVPKGKGKS